MRNGNFGFNFVDGCRLIHGGRLLMLDTPRSDEAQLAEEPVLGEIDMNVTKEDLDVQLAELQGIMSRMG
jgi:hypothetical protein